MKAINPDDPTGPLIDLRFADGPMYTERCPACGRENGIWIDTPETPVPREPCAETSLECVWCGHRTEYVLVAGWDGAVG